MGKSITAAGGLFPWLREKANFAINNVIRSLNRAKIKLKELRGSIIHAGGFFPWLAIKAKMACNAIGTAIKGIPVIGWIIVIGTAVTALFAILYTKFEGFV